MEWLCCLRLYSGSLASLPLPYFLHILYERWDIALLALTSWTVRHIPCTSLTNGEISCYLYFSHDKKLFLGSQLVPHSEHTLFPLQKLIAYMYIDLMDSRGVQIFQKFGSHLKILGVRWVTWSKFHTKQPQILGATTQNLVATEILQDLFTPDVKCL